MARDMPKARITNSFVGRCNDLHPKRSANVLGRRCCAAPCCRPLSCLPGNSTEESYKNMETSWTNLLQRRKLLRTASLGAVATAFAMKVTGADAQTAPTDPEILNFALNLEYLEAEYYLRAVTGTGLAGNGVGVNGVGGSGGTVTGGSKVAFQSRQTYELALEIAKDEMAHVKLLRQALDSAAVAEPAIDLSASFAAAAAAAGLGNGFSPFASEADFLLGAFIFEDVGVSAYAGAAQYISNKAYLTTAAQILAVEAYHAGEIRTRLLLGGFASQSNQIAALRAKASNMVTTSGAMPVADHGVMASNGLVTIVDADANALAYTRTTGQVLNVVYLGSGVGTTSGGFFPNGMNGAIRTVT